MALTTTTALSYYQQESATISEWNNPINFSLDALSADDIEVCAIASQGPSGYQKVSLVKGVDYTLDFDAKTVTCTDTHWSDLDAIQDADYPPDQIRVFRSTGVGSLVDYTDGAVLNAADLNLSYKQSLFATQEMNEDAGFTRGGVQSVTTAALGDLSVSSGKIQDNAVTASKISDNAVTTAKIDEEAVTADELATNSVTEEKIATDAVTENKLATDAVTTVKIEDEAVTYDKVAPASKAQMEGQSAAGVVTPDVLKHSPFSPRAYGVIQYDADGADSMEAGSYNVDVTATEAEANATNTRKIYFDTDLANTNYTVVTTVQGASGTDGRNFIKQKEVGYFVIESDDVGHVANRKINFVVFGSTYDS